MLRQITKYGIMILAGIYLLFAFVIIPGKADTDKCKGIFIAISDSTGNVMTRESLIELLKEADLDPNGKEMDSIMCRDIEKHIASLSVVNECQVYKTTGNYVDIAVNCRIPILKINTATGEGFYIDSLGKKITNLHRPLHLPVATGHVNDSILKKDVCEIANAINRNKFWQAQIEQIHFEENGEIIIVPRVGNHIVEFGKAENAEKKLEDLYTFYQKGLNVIGWNKYSKLSLKYPGRVIGTKREEKKRQ